MKIKIYIKDPDGFYESIRVSNDNLLDDSQIEMIEDGLEKWVKYCESFVLEYDTDENTLIVLEVDDES